MFGGGADVIDLDEPEYFAPSDLAGVRARRRSPLLGAERPGNPYAEHAVAAPVARRIAALAERNFLIAGLIARSHGLYDTAAVTRPSLSFTATVDAALAAYLERLHPVGGVPARSVLTALAYAQAPGWPPTLWQVALDALGGTISREALAGFAARRRRTSWSRPAPDAGTSPVPAVPPGAQRRPAARRGPRAARRGDERALAAAS